MTKSEIRAENLKQRKQMSPLEVDVKSKAICGQLLKNFTFEGIHTLHIFLPIKNNNEINTNYLIENIRHMYPTMQIVVPRVVDDNGTMESVVLEPDTELVNNSWGIPEPKDGKVVDDQEVDMVIAPMVGFDSFGNRVGYGKGYYDKFFKQCREDVCKVGLSLEEPVFKVEDIQDYDVGLEYVITAERVFIFKQEVDTV